MLLAGETMPMWEPIFKPELEELRVAVETRISWLPNIIKPELKRLRVAGETRLRWEPNIKALNIKT